MAKKYMVDMSEKEQAMLNSPNTSGTQRVRKIIHARVILKLASRINELEVPSSHLRKK